MIVWGGHVFEEEYGDGAAYDPEQDTWSLLPDAPVDPRYSHSAVWTDEEMIVWGGATTVPSILADGAAFTGTWNEIEETRPARSLHTAAWAGTEMLVFGGCCDPRGLELGGGAAYDPATRSWTTLPDVDLGPRQAHSAVWTGDAMLVWGGRAGESVFHADGAAYAPSDRTWTRLPEAPLLGRGGHTAVWTEAEMLVWGGCCDESQRAFADGAAFPRAQAPTPAPGTPEPADDDAAAGPSPDDGGVSPFLPLGVFVAAAVLIGGAVGLLIRSRRRGRDR
jgi:hypothetical protein